MQYCVFRTLKNKFTEANSQKCHRKVTKFTIHLLKLHQIHYWLEFSHTDFVENKLRNVSKGVEIW